MIWILFFLQALEILDLRIKTHIRHWKSQRNASVVKQCPWSNQEYCYESCMVDVRTNCAGLNACSFLCCESSSLCWVRARGSHHYQNDQTKASWHSLKRTHLAMTVKIVSSNSDNSHNLYRSWYVELGWNRNVSLSIKDLIKQPYSIVKDEVKEKS